MLPVMKPQGNNYCNNIAILNFLNMNFYVFSCEKS